MPKDSFIDGLMTRSEKKAQISPEKPKNFSSGYYSYENGDPLVSRSRRRDLTNSTEMAVFGASTKEQKQIARKVESVNITSHTEIVTKTEKDAVFTKNVVRPMAAEKSSYSRDVLGIEEDDDGFDFEFDSDDLKKQKKKNKKKKKKFIFRHKIISFIGIPLLIAFSVAYFWGDSVIKNITGGQSGLFDLVRTLVAPGDQEFKTDKNGRTNILVFGTSGYDMSGSEGNGVHSGAQLTDSIMVVSINQSTRDVAMVSLPRDLKTDTCTSVDKINELYYCSNKKNNNEKAGAESLQSRVSSMLDLDIQYYVHINWMSLIQIVDALGGITVTLDEDVNDPYTNTYIKAGVPTNLNGTKALGLARARHGTNNGDFTRGNSQQKILIAIKNRLSEQNFSLSWFVNMVNILGENLRTDFTVDTITAGAKFFIDKDIESIRQVQLYSNKKRYFTTGRIDGISYTYPSAGVSNYTAIQKFVKSELNSDPMKTENARILILNGSGVEGAAEIEKEVLINSGFEYITTGNAPSGEYFGKIYLYMINNKTAAKEKLEIYYDVETLDKDALSTEINTKDVDFVIILGVDYSD